MTGDEAIPDQAIEFELIFVEVLGNGLRRVEDVGRPNGLMGILGTRNILNLTAVFTIFFAKGIDDIAGRCRLGNWRDTCRVGTHIGNQPLMTIWP